MLRKARKGTRIVYVPGNHDEFLREYYGTHFGGIEVVENAIHKGVDGKRYLVIHGDLFDLVVTQARWLAHLGDKAYDTAILLNRWFNTVRRRFGFPYWSLSQWAKLKVKNAVSYIGDYEKTLTAEAHRHGADGVICGHIHHAAIHDEFGLRYINCGDWVESCSAIVEHFDGRFEILTWIEADEIAGSPGCRPSGITARRPDRCLAADPAYEFGCATHSRLPMPVAACRDVSVTKLQQGLGIRRAASAIADVGWIPRPQ